MATTFDDVIDLALTTIQDYKLNEIYQTNPDNFNIVTEGFLIRGLAEFYNCKNSLAYDLTNKTFLVELTSMEISILADLWVYEWFMFKIQNVTQIENKVSSTDFKHYSEAENLKQKYEYLARIREKYGQKIVDYNTLNANWSAMGNGDFGV